ncbi:MAG: mechanosensitive ion channel [Ignavibacteriales bacterium]|nr:mechanosensitive ion channel [Ignavibacteriales bacterium]
MNKFLNIALLIFICFLTVYGQTDSTAIKKSTSPESAAHTKVQKDTAKSAIENLEAIIPDENVKEKLTDIFSLSKIIWAVIFFLVSYYVIKFVTKILDKFSEKSARYRITLKGVIPVVRILGWTIVISIVIIVIFAPPIESLVVVTGSLGIAVGFASQDIIRNIFGGIMTLFDRPFQVGDKVEVGGYYGEVKSIGLRSTRIVTPDDSVVSIPNGDIMSKSVSNANTGETNCQVVAELFLPSYIDLEKVRGIAIKSAQVSKYIYLKKPIAVIFKNEIYHNRSMIKMRLKAYVLDIRYEFAFMSEMTENTLRELIKHNLINKEELDAFEEAV